MAENHFRKLWDRFQRVPAGSHWFDRVIARQIPYTGSIRAHVEVLERGYARVSMKDRKRLRNHLQSVHAIALANLAEYTGNLALAYSLPDEARFIVKALQIDYTKKARGTINAECHAPLIDSAEKRQYDLTVVLKDAGDVEVARAILQTLVGPAK